MIRLNDIIEDVNKYLHLNDKDEPDIDKTYLAIKNLFNEVKYRYKDIFYESDSIEFNKEIQEVFYIKE